MRTRTLFVILLSVLLTLVAGCAEMSGTTKPSASALSSIQSRGELVLGTAASMPPLNMTAKDGEVIGFEIDVARAMAESMGVDIRVQTMPFSELLPALEAGRVDMVMSGMTMTPQRNLRAAFVGPYLVSGKCVLTKLEGVASSKDPSNINKPDLKLAALEGSTSQAYVETFIPDATLVKVKNYDAGLNLVFNDEIDALVAEYPICVVSLVRHADKGLVTVLSLLSYEPLGVALPANDPLFVNWVENFLNRLSETRHLKRMKDRWFEEGDWLDRLP